MANFLESRPTFAQDTSGRENIVYQADDGTLWHARYDSDAQEWVDAQAIPVSNANPAFNLKLLSSRYMVPTGNSDDPYAPGLMLLWQEDVDNQSDLYYSVARFDNDGDLQWSNAVLIDTQTNDGSDVADENFDAEFLLQFSDEGTPEPSIVIVEQRFDADLEDGNGIQSDDPDLYFITVEPDDFDLVFETASTPTASVDDPGTDAQLPFITDSDTESLSLSTEPSAADAGIARPAVLLPDPENPEEAVVVFLTEAEQAALENTVGTELVDGTVLSAEELQLVTGNNAAALETDASESESSFQFGALAGIYVELRLNPQNANNSATSNLQFARINIPVSFLPKNLRITLSAFAQTELVSTVGDEEVESAGGKNLEIDFGGGLDLLIGTPVEGDSANFPEATVSAQTGGEISAAYAGSLLLASEDSGAYSSESLNNELTISVDIYTLRSFSLGPFSALIKGEAGLSLLFDWERPASQTTELGDLGTETFFELEDRDGDVVTSDTPLSDVFIVVDPAALASSDDFLTDSGVGDEDDSNSTFTFSAVPFLKVSGRASVYFLGGTGSAEGYLGVSVSDDDGDDDGDVVIGISAEADARALGVSVFEISIKEEATIASFSDGVEELSALESSNDPELTPLYSPLPGSDGDYSQAGVVVAVPAISSEDVTEDTLIDGPPDLQIFQRGGSDEVLLAWSKGVEVTTTDGEGDKPPSSFIQLNLAELDTNTELFWEASADELDFGGVIDGQGEDSIADTSSLNSDPTLGTFETSESSGDVTFTPVVVWVYQTATDLVDQDSTTVDSVTEVLANTEIRFSYLETEADDWNGSWTTPEILVEGFAPGSTITGLNLQTLDDGRVLAAWLQPPTTVELDLTDGDSDNVRIYYSVWDGPGETWSEPTFVARDLSWIAQDLGTTLSDADTNGLVAGDFDGDGFDDLVRQTASGAELLLSNRYSGSFTTETLDESAFELSDETALSVGDFNGDGVDDILVQGDSDTLELYLGSADGFGDPQSITVDSVALSTSAIAVGDFNGDGLSDFLRQETGSSTGNVTPFLASVSDETVSFTAVDTTLDAAEGSQLVVGDFNGDGDADVLVQSATADTEEATLYLYKGDDTFEDAQTIAFDQTVAVGQVTLSAADLNADSITDLVRQELVDTDDDGALSATALIADADSTFTAQSDSIALFDTDNPVTIVTGSFDNSLGDDFIAQGAGSSDITQTFLTQIASPGANLGLQSGLLDDLPTLFWQSQQPASYFYEVDGDVPVLYYRLGEVDSSTATNDGTLGSTFDATYSGEITQGETGALAPGDYDFATSFSSDAGFSVANTGGALPLDSFTVEFWVQFTESSGQVAIDQDWTISLTPTTLSADLDDTTTTADIDLPLDQWHHIVVSYRPAYTTTQLDDDGNSTTSVTVPSTVEFYVDGRSVALAQDVDWVGAGNDLTVTASGATLDEFALYDGALTGDASPSPFDTSGGDLFINEGGVSQVTQHFAAQLRSFDAGSLKIYQTELDVADETSTNREIVPLAQQDSTQLSVERSGEFDIVSPSALSPNGVTDLHFILTLGEDTNTGKFNLGQLGETITGILLTDTTTDTKWIAGEISGETGNFLGVVQGSELLNSRDPDVTAFSHTIVGLEESFELYADPADGEGADTDSFTVQLYGASGELLESALSIQAIASEGSSPVGDLDLVQPTEPDPNGIEDLYFDLNIAGASQESIQSIILEQIQTYQPTDETEQTQTYQWAVVGSEETAPTDSDYLGVTVNDSFLSDSQQSTDTSLYTFASTENITFRLLADPVDVTSIPSDSTLVKTEYIVTVEFASGDSLEQSITPIGADFVVANSVLETDTTALDDIDSGVILTVDDASTGQTAVGGDFDDDSIGDLALGVPGYNSKDGGVLVKFGEITDAISLDAGSSSSDYNTVWIAGLSGYGEGAGYSLATGDVDGDGQDDIIVGAPNANDNQGKVYVVYGSALSSGTTFELCELTTTPSEQGFVLEGQQDLEEFGFAVAAGDVDGDGIAEIIVGAPYYSYSQSNQAVGRVYVVYGDNDDKTINTLFTGGTSETVPDPLGKPDTTATVGVQAGFSVAVSASTNDADDGISFNGDQYADILIGAPNVYRTYTYTRAGGESAQETIDSLSDTFSQFEGLLEMAQGPTTRYYQSGDTYLIYGDSSDLSDLTKSKLLDDGSGAVLEASPTGQSDVGAGLAVNFAGDLNGDGLDDAAVGAPLQSTNSGSVFIVRGQTGTFTDNTVDLNVDSSSILNGTEQGAQVGRSLAQAGDVNDDGKDDLLIASPNAGYSTGRGYVLFGDADLDAEIDLSSTGQTGTLVLNGGNPQNFTAQAVTGVGDVNDDGIDDLVVTAPQVGEAYVVYGKDYLRDDGSITLSQLRDDNGFVLESNSSAAYSLTSPATLGDVNGDGFDDILRIDSSTISEQFLRFDNDDSYAVVEASNAEDFNFEDAFTVAFWMRAAPNQPLDTASVLDKWNEEDNDPFPFVFRYKDDTGEIQAARYNPADDPNFVDLVAPIEAGVFQHVAFVRETSGDDATLKLYINGALSEQTTDTVSDATNHSGLFFGARGLPSGVKDFFIGDLNDVGLWDTALDADQVADLADTSSSDIPEESSLVGYYTFDNGTVDDTSGNGNDGTLEGGAKIVPSTEQFLSFSDGDSYAVVGASEADDYNFDDAFTVAFWVRADPNQPLNTASVLDKWNEDDDDPFPFVFRYKDETGEIQAARYNKDDGGFVDLVAPIEAGVFQHVAFVRETSGDDATLKLYINGALSEQTTDTVSDATNHSGLFFGARGATSGIKDFFNGDLNDVGLWDAALDADQIAELADGSSSDIPEVSSLVGYYTFNDGTVNDLSGNGNDGTLEGRAEILPLQQFATVELGGNSSELINESAFGLSTLTSSTGDSINAEGGDVIGDFNTDGYADLLVSYDGTLTLYSGSALTLDVADTVEQPYSSAIVDISPIGDINGDGFDDLSILTTSYTAQIAYVVYGNADGALPDDLTSLGQNEGFVISVDNTPLTNLTQAGDLNGDGLDDLAISWYQSDNNKIIGAGIVVLGQRNRGNLELGDLSSVSALRDLNDEFSSNQVLAIRGNVVKENGGIQNQNFQENLVSGIGDVNGDGFSDLSLNANYVKLYDAETIERDASGLETEFFIVGQTTITLLNDSFWTSPQLNGSLEPVSGSSGTTITIFSTATELNFGNQVSHAGDVNGDGFDDFIVGQLLEFVDSNPEIQAYVVFGSETLEGGNISSLTEANQGFGITGLLSTEKENEIAIQGGGDINGDGFADLIITQPDETDSPTFYLFGGDFTASVNQVGTLGNDIMEGSASGDNLIGAGGRDLIRGNGGADYIQAGLDDDFIIVADTNFELVDGGPGTDAFQLAGYVDQDYDLTEFLEAGSLRNIEFIDLSDYGSNTLTLPDALLLYRLSDTSNTLIITGDSEDIVAFTDSGTESLTVLDGIQYRSFTIDNMTVLLEENLQFTDADLSELSSAIQSTEQAATDTLDLSASLASELTSTVAVTSTSSGKAQLVVSSPIASSDDEAVEFHIERTDGLLERVVAEYYTTNLEVITQGGQDYSPVAGILVFEPGEKSKTVSVPLRDDDKPTFQRPKTIGLRLKQLENLPGADPEAIAERRVEIKTSDETTTNKWQVIASPEFEADNEHAFITLDMRTTVTDVSGKLQLVLNYPDDSLEDADVVLFYDMATQDWKPWIGERQFIDLTGDGQPNQVVLSVTDGGIGDLDGRSNGTFSALITLAQFGTTLSGDDGTRNTLRGTVGNDQIIGGDRSDNLFGLAGDDMIKGRGGNDRLFGEADDDVLDGGAGNDLLVGGKGTNTLTGGRGNDIFEITSGEKAIITDFGGMGRGSKPTQATLKHVDTITLTTEGLTANTLQLTQVGDNLELTFLGDDADTTVVLQDFELENLDNLLGKTGANVDFDNIEFMDDRLKDSIDVFNVGSRRNRIWNRNSVTFLNDRDNRVKGFSRSNDVINGQGGDDLIRGLSGDDTLRGGDGDDILKGDRGDDILRGSQGNDRLKGGFGSDIFVIGVGKGTDFIQDFEMGTDLIGLSDNLSFGQLTLNADEILFEDEILAILQGVNTEVLTEADFVYV